MVFNFNLEITDKQQQSNLKGFFTKELFVVAFLVNFENLRDNM